MPTITTDNGFQTVADLLSTYQDTLVTSNDPLVNNQLRYLLGELYNVQDNITGNPLARPIVASTDTMTNTALIALLMQEMRKTHALVSVSTEIEIKQNQAKINIRNKQMMENLKKAEDAQKKAKEIGDGLGIFKWLMLAVSVIMTIVSAVATVLSFGATTGAVVASATTLAISVALVIATSIPINSNEETAMDMLSQKMTEGIANATKKALIEDYNNAHDVKWDKLTEQQQQEILTQAQDTGQYTTMAILIAVQLAIAVAMIAITAGRSSGSSATYVVNSVANDTAQATESALSTALQSAKQAMAQIGENLSKNLPRLMQITKMTQFGGGMIQGAGTVGSASAQFAKGAYQFEASDTKADTEKIKALIKLLQSMDDTFIALIKQLNLSTADSWRAVGNIIKTNHRLNRAIYANTDGASAV